MYLSPHLQRGPIRVTCTLPNWSSGCLALIAAELPFANDSMDSGQLGSPDINVGPSGANSSGFHGIHWAHSDFH